MANYVVYEKSKKILAEVAELTEKELKAVMNYQALGYKLVGKKEKDETKETAKRVNAEYVKKYLEKDKTALDTFTKKKGVEALQWFKANYPTDIEEYKKVEEAVEKALNEKAKATTIDDMYKAYYAKPIKDENDEVITDENKIKEKKQKKEEYIRCYYWNKIFTR